MTTVPDEPQARGSNGEGQVNTVTWWEIPVSDLAVAKPFYSAVFGWTFMPFGPDENTYAAIMSGGQLIGGMFRSDQPDGGVRVYVNVADMESVFEAVQTAGGTVSTPRSEVGDDLGWWGDFVDPTGRTLGICSDNPAVR